MLYLFFVFYESKSVEFSLNVVEVFDHCRCRKQNGAPLNTLHTAQYGHKQSLGSKIYLNGTKTRFFIWPGGRTHKLESVDIFPGNFLFSPLSVVAQNFLWLRWLFLVSSMAVELVIARVQTSKGGTKHVMYCENHLRSISLCKIYVSYYPLCRLKDAPLSFC